MDSFDTFAAVLVMGWTVVVGLVAITAILLNHFRRPKDPRSPFQAWMEDWSIKGPEGEPFSPDIRGRVGPGWVPLLDVLAEDLYTHGWDGRLTYIKEKFGGLRFSPSYQWDHFTRSESLPEADADRFRAMDSAIYDAERLSTKVCEVCGEPGGVTLWTSFWTKALCPDHAGQGNNPKIRKLMGWP